MSELMPTAAVDGVVMSSTVPADIVICGPFWTTKGRGVCRSARGVSVASRWSRPAAVSVLADAAVDRSDVE